MNIYQQTAHALLPSLGGSENVEEITHCITRARMRLRNREAIKLGTLRSHPAILGAQWENAELQLILGPYAAAPLTHALAESSVGSEACPRCDTSSRQIGGA